MTGMYGEEEFIEERSCWRSLFGCLCGTSSCRLCCRFCPTVNESTATRIVYIFFHLMCVGLMAIMMSKDVQEAVMKMFPEHNVVCRWVGAGDHCEAALGYMAVYRLGFAFTAYHILLMLTSCRVSSSRQCRAGIHNGMWFYKFILMIVFCVGSFFIPDPNDLFITVWMYVAMAAAALFIVIQLLLLVFLYHSWTDRIVARVRSGGSSCCWYGGVAVTATVVVYLVCAAGIGVLYYYFALSEGCDRNRWFIIFNTAACASASVVAGVKSGKKDFRLRLLHSSLISFYVVYLTWTAISSAPRKYQVVRDRASNVPLIGSSRFEILDQEFYCGPNEDEEDLWTDEILPYVSLAITLMSVAYSAFRTSNTDNCQAIEFPSCPSHQTVQRFDVEDIGGQKVVRNEAVGLAYSYSLFHVMIGLATLYMMMSLTAWYTPSSATLVTFGRSWSAVWIKMSSSWVCLLIYVAVTLYPSMLPNNQDRVVPMKRRMSNGYAGSLRGSLRSLDEDEAAVPLSPSKPATIVHQETTV